MFYSAFVFGYIGDTLQQFCTFLDFSLNFRYSSDIFISLNNLKMRNMIFVDCLTLDTERKRMREVS